MSNGNIFEQPNLTPQEQQRFAQLNQEFRQLLPNFQEGFGRFGTGGIEAASKRFGVSVEDLQGLASRGIDINRLNTDASYRAVIEGFAGRDPKVAQLLSEIREFQGGLASGFQKVDIGAIFDPLKAEIDKLSAQGLQSQKAELSRAGRGAERTATEALAGTGLGRSGVAAQTFADIGKQKVESLERITSQAERSRQAAQLDLEFKKSQIQYSEELAKRGFSQEQIRDATEFDRQLFMMQFQAQLEAELQEAQQGSGFIDFINGLGNLAQGIGSIIGGGGGGGGGGVVEVER